MTCVDRFPKQLKLWISDNTCSYYHLYCIGYYRRLLHNAVTCHYRQRCYTVLRIRLCFACICRALKNINNKPVRFRAQFCKMSFIRFFEVYPIQPLPFYSEVRALELFNLYLITCLCLASCVVMRLTFHISRSHMYPKTLLSKPSQNLQT